MAAVISRVVLAFVLLAPLALAQDATPVLVEFDDSRELVVNVGSPVEAIFDVRSLHPTHEHLVSIALEERSRWILRAEPAEFFLEPRNTSEVKVFIEPTFAPRARVTSFEVTFTIVDSMTGETANLVREVEVVSGAPPPVVDLFENPLPPPLDNAYGSFALGMLFWIGFAIVSVFAGDVLVRVVAARASSATVSEMVRKLRWPVFYFVLFLGLARTFSVLPRFPAVVWIEKGLILIAVTAFGLYVVYRLLDVGLLYYQRELAPRTRTHIDDIVVPVIRNVGLIIIYIIGILVTLRRLGWDPTLIFAGAGIAGLVIAFAAQDTFSNLFSGVFLLLDRPFVEGDDIRLETGEVARVQQVGLRTTRLYIGRSHETIVLPNNQLATTRVVNLTGPDRRYWLMIEVGTSYGSDPEHVRRTLIDVARSHPHVVKEAPDWEPIVLFTNFGDSALLFTLRVPVDDYRQRFVIASDIRFAINEAFRREEIEIPFPQRVLHIKSQEGVARE